MFLVTQPVAPIAILQAKIWKTTFWMAHFGSRTPKGHALFSNSKATNAFNMGKLAVRARKKGPAAVVQYRDAQGRARFKGTRFLKQTESLDSEQ